MAKNSLYNHREYPKKHYLSAPGFCRWCDNEILDRSGLRNTRKNWCNKECVGNYLLRADPKVMRRYVFFRDNGKCGACGQVWEFMSDPWDADHIKPLYVSFGDLRFWEPDNVVLLCRKPCHQNKSQSDKEKYGAMVKRWTCES